MIKFKAFVKLISGNTYNGECIHKYGVHGNSIHIRSTYYGSSYNSTRIEDCFNFCNVYSDSGYGTSPPSTYQPTDFTTDFTTWWWDWRRKSDSRVFDEDKTEKKEQNDESDFQMETSEMQNYRAQEYQYFGIEDYGRSKSFSFIKSTIVHASIHSD